MDIRNIYLVKLEDASYNSLWLVSARNQKEAIEIIWEENSTWMSDSTGGCTPYHKSNLFARNIGKGIITENDEGLSSILLNYHG